MEAVRAPQGGGAGVREVAGQNAAALQRAAVANPAAYNRAANQAAERPGEVLAADGKQAGRRTGKPRGASTRGPIPPVGGAACGFYTGHHKTVIARTATGCAAVISHISPGIMAGIIRSTSMSRSSTMVPMSKVGYDGGPPSSRSRQRRGGAGHPPFEHHRVAPDDRATQPARQHGESRARRGARRQPRAEPVHRAGFAGRGGPGRSSHPPGILSGESRCDVPSGHGSGVRHFQQDNYLAPPVT